MQEVWGLKGTHGLSPCAVYRQEGYFRECKCCDAGEIFTSAGGLEKEIRECPADSLVTAKPVNGTVDF